MSPKTFTLATTITLSSLLLGGCVAGKYTAAEQEMAETLTGARFQPSTRQQRDNIETQDLLAQAAFWSREHSLNPGDLEAAIKLAAAVRKMGNPGQAIEITQQTRALYPRDPYLTAEYAAALIASERGVDAIDPLDDALRSASGYARLWSLKGAALDQMEKYELARKHYSRALQITPYDPNVMANMGLNYALSGDLQSAETWMRRAADIPGAGQSVRQNLAIVLQLQGKTQEAGNLLPRRPQRLATAPARRPVAQNTAPRTYGHQMTAPQTYAQPQRQAQTQPYAQPMNHSASATATQAPQMRASYTAPSPAGHAQYPTRAQAGEPGTRLRSTSVSNQGAAPTKTASDAAREAAQNMTRRKYTETVSTNNEQQAVLDNIARNLGPRSADMPMQAGPSVRAPQGPSQPINQELAGAYAPEMLPRRNYASNTRPQQMAVPQPTYASPQQPQTQSRGRARTR